jgi:hypothetical protein
VSELDELYVMARRVLLDALHALGVLLERQRRALRTLGYKHRGISALSCCDSGNTWVAPPAVTRAK